MLLWVAKIPRTTWRSEHHAAFIKEPQWDPAFRQWKSRSATGSDLSLNGNLISELATLPAHPQLARVDTTNFSIIDVRPPPEDIYFWAVPPNTLARKEVYSNIPSRFADYISHNTNLELYELPVWYIDQSYADAWRDTLFCRDRHTVKAIWLAYETDGQLRPTPYALVQCPICGEFEGETEYAPYCSKECAKVIGEYEWYLKQDSEWRRDFEAGEYDGRRRDRDMLADIILSRGPDPNFIRACSICGARPLWLKDLIALERTIEILFVEEGLSERAADRLRLPSKPRSTYYYYREKLLCPTCFRGTPQDLILGKQRHASCTYCYKRFSSFVDQSLLLRLDRNVATKLYCNSLPQPRGRSGRYILNWQEERIAAVLASLDLRIGEDFLAANDSEIIACNEACFISYLSKLPRCRVCNTTIPSCQQFCSNTCREIYRSIPEPRRRFDPSTFTMEVERCLNRSSPQRRSRKKSKRRSTPAKRR